MRGVEVAWEHDGKRYRAKRMCRAYKQQTEVNIVNNELLYLYIGDADGKWLHPPTTARRNYWQNLTC